MALTSLITCQLRTIIVCTFRYTKVVAWMAGKLPKKLLITSEKGTSFGRARPGAWRSWGTSKRSRIRTEAWRTRYRWKGAAIDVQDEVAGAGSVGVSQVRKGMKTKKGCERHRSNNLRTDVHKNKPSPPGASRRQGEREGEEPKQRKSPAKFRKVLGSVEAVKGRLIRLHQSGKLLLVVEEIKDGTG